MPQKQKNGEKATQLVQRAASIARERRELAGERAAAVAAAAAAASVRWDVDTDSGSATTASKSVGNAFRTWSEARRKRYKSRLHTAADILKAHPETWALPLALALLLAALGVAGVLLGARAAERDARVVAQGIAHAAGVALHVTVENCEAPLIAMANSVRESPRVTTAGAWFERDAPALYASLPLNTANGTNIQLLPQGVITHIYPLKGNAAALGLDLFTEPVRRQAALETIERDAMTMQGPVRAAQGWTALFFRLPVWIDGVSSPAELFGAPAPAYNCSVCYDAARRRRLWGFAAVVLNVGDFGAVSDSDFETRLDQLEGMGYHYVLWAPLAGGGRATLAGSAAPPARPVSRSCACPRRPSATGGSSSLPRAAGRRRGARR